MDSAPSIPDTSIEVDVTDSDCQLTSDSAINVGSRRSELALVQTNRVIQKLKEFYDNNPDRLEQLRLTSGSRLGKEKRCSLSFNVVSMTTTGDVITDRPLPSIGTKALFTRELELALLKGEVDFVVHSLKDLPTTLPEGCAIGAILKRDNPEDTIVLKNSLRSKVNPLDFLMGKVSGLGDGHTKVGTSSQRRIAMIKNCNPNLECIDIRGNLNTRISKLDCNESEYAAIILAQAGLDRMGWSGRGSSLLKPEVGLPNWHYAVGQGALAVECRLDDEFTLDLLSPIVDLNTTYEALAERSLMKKLQGGCSVPLGVRSTWTFQTKGGGSLCLEGIFLSGDGKRTVKSRQEALLPTVSTLPIDNSSSDFFSTGITLSKSALLSPNIRQAMIVCADLGIKVGQDMIEQHCLELMKN